jgi:hypothetical protein
MLEKAASPRIFGEQCFNHSSQLRVASALLIEKGIPLHRLECQRGLEQLLDQISLTSHKSQSIECGSKKACAKTVVR